MLWCVQKQIHSEISSNVGGALAEIETMRQEAEEFAEAERMKQAENLFRRAMGKMQNAVAASCFEVCPRPTPQTHASRLTRPPDCFKSGS